MSEYIVCPHCHNPLSPAEYVKVVRCRDCEHSYLFDMSWKSPKTDDKRYCKYGSFLQYEVSDDGFCAWGERRDA